MEYSRVFGSNYPDEMIPVGTKKDIDSNVKLLVSQYYDFMSNGHLEAANKLYQGNKATLEPYIIDSNYFNRLEEEIYNTGVMACDIFNNKQSIIVSDTEPSSQALNSMWLKEW